MKMGRGAMRCCAIWWGTLWLAIVGVVGAVRAGTVATFPGDVWTDVGELPAAENAWWLFGGAALTTVVYQFEDADGGEVAFNKGVLGDLSRIGNVWGDGRLQAPLVLGLWGVGQWTDNSELAGLGYDLSRSLFLTYATTGVLKVAINRPRPNGDSHSFPSGHTSAAFSFVGVVSRRYGGWSSGAAISLGLMTGMGRMAARKHYASDVAAGATIGWIMGRNAGRTADLAGVSWQVIPFGRGLAVSGRF